MNNILKWAIAGFSGYLGYKYLISKAFDNIKSNISFAVAGGRIHKLSLNSGIDLRINLDMTNLTPIDAKISEMVADIYYIHPDGTPSFLANTSLTSFTISANRTSRIDNVRIIIPAQSVLRNFSILSDKERHFKVVIRAIVNGRDFETTQTFRL